MSLPAQSHTQAEHQLRVYSLKAQALWHPHFPNRVSFVSEPTLWGLCSLIKELSSSRVTWDAADSICNMKGYFSLFLRLLEQFCFKRNDCKGDDILTNDGTVDLEVTNSPYVEDLTSWCLSTTSCTQRPYRGFLLCYIQKLKRTKNSNRAHVGTSKLQHLMSSILLHLTSIFLDIFSNLIWRQAFIFHFCAA